MKQAVVKIAALLLMLMTTAVARPTHWRVIGPGLEYTAIPIISGFHTGHVHAFRIDLKHNQLKLAVAEDQRNKISTVSDLVAMNKAVIGVNGGFFSQELKPLGLRISDFKTRYPLKATRWWSVFYIAENQPHIVSQKEFKPAKDIQFAVQSGPRLLRDHHLALSLKAGVDARTAIGITPTGKVILVITDNLKLTTMELAKIMKSSTMDGGLDCKDAMNLDGGSSTQASVKTQAFQLEVPSYSAVTDAVLVIPRP